MPDLTFNTKPGATIERKLLVLYLNTGEKMSPKWAPIGKRVEDSSVEMDWSEDSKTDIFGEVYTNVKKPVLTQTFDPYELDAGDAAHVKIWNQAIKDQDTAAVTSNDLLMVHLYAGTKDTAAFAERYDTCKVVPTKLGGSSTVDMSIEVTFGGKRTTGTARMSDGSPTFNADV